MKSSDSVLEAWLTSRDPMQRPTDLQLQRWARAHARREIYRACKRLVSGLFRQVQTA